jgi:hypothetical protein
MPAPTRKGGRQRRYCSHRCRTEAYRDRQAKHEWIDFEPAPQVVTNQQLRAELEAVFDEVLISETRAAPEDRLARAIIESKTLASTYQELSREVEPNLSWRASRMSETLSAAIQRYFGAAT